MIDLLVDSVIQNGNLLLNVPPPNNGVPDSDELAILAEITAWMQVNSECSARSARKRRLK